MFAEFVHYYPGYTAETALNEYAVRFYALLNGMYRLKAAERIEQTISRAVSTSGGDGLTNYLENEKRQAGGGHAILEEVRTVKRAQQNVNIGR